jgi:hypothetical protein
MPQMRGGFTAVEEGVGGATSERSLSPIGERSRARAGGESGLGEASACVGDAICGSKRCCPGFFCVTRESSRENPWRPLSRDSDRSIGVCPCVRRCPSSSGRPADGRGVDFAGIMMFAGVRRVAAQPVKVSDGVSLCARWIAGLNPPPASFSPPTRACSRGAWRPRR